MHLSWFSTTRGGIYIYLYVFAEKYKQAPNHPYILMNRSGNHGAHVFVIDCSFNGKCCFRMKKWKQMNSTHRRHGECEKEWIKRSRKKKPHMVWSFEAIFEFSRQNRKASSLHWDTNTSTFTHAWITLAKNHC